MHTDCHAEAEKGIVLMIMTHQLVAAITVHISAAQLDLLSVVRRQYPQGSIDRCRAQGRSLSPSCLCGSAGTERVQDICKEVHDEGMLHELCSTKTRSCNSFEISQANS